MTTDKIIVTKPAPIKVMFGKNFTLDELCVTASGLPNVPGEKEIENLRALVENVLQPIRDHYGKPVKGTSFFRSPEVNAKAGGAAGSQHLHGQAGDITVEGVRNEDLWHFIVDPANKIPFDQCIAEHLHPEDGKKGWVHVSFSLTQRRAQAFSIVKVNGQNLTRPGLVFES